MYRIRENVSMLVCCVLFALHRVCAYADLETHPHWFLMDHQSCGATSSDRIIGGTNASLGQFPWLARIGYTSETNNDPKVSFKCGGSLINTKYVLTAAHCVTELPDIYVSTVRLGEHNALTEIDCEDNVCADLPQDIPPAWIIVHKYYGKPAYKHDIALIRLTYSAELNPWVHPICLPTTKQLEQSYRGATAQVAGWGVSDLTRIEASDYLLYVNLPVVSVSKCSRLFRKWAEVGKTQLCVGGVVGKDSCGGDSGGPLMIVEAMDGPPRYYQVGIVSFGAMRCGSTTTPAVYTRIGSYMGWILDNIYA